MYFISYARSDQDFARQLAEDLTSAGHRVWLDQLVLRPSDVWERQIELALEESKTVVVVVTSGSIASMNVLAEINYALELNKTVIPVLADDCKIPFRLRTIQSIDFRKDYKAALQRLLRNLNQEGGAKSATPIPIAVGPGGSESSIDESDRQSLAEPFDNLPKRSPGREAQVQRGTGTVLTFDSFRECFLTPRFEQKVKVDQNIDRAMLTNAIHNMSIDPAIRVRALIDLTVFGSAKEALLFGEFGMFFIDRELQRTKELSYTQIKTCKFRRYAAPFVSKHVSIVELTVADRAEYRFGVAGGPMNGEELVELLSALRGSATNAASQETPSK